MIILLTPMPTRTSETLFGFVKNVIFDEMQHHFREGIERFTVVWSFATWDTRKSHWDRLSKNSWLQASLPVILPVLCVLWSVDQVGVAYIVCVYSVSSLVVNLSSVQMQEDSSLKPLIDKTSHLCKLLNSNKFWGGSQKQLLPVSEGQKDMRENVLSFCQVHSEKLGLGSLLPYFGVGSSFECE